jgi:RND family efflux transporter MFP subunit
VAPISGTVTHLAVTKGQAVDRTQALLEIENLNSVWVTASVPEADSGKVKTGAKVRVTVASEPGQDFVGIVQLIGSRVDPKSRSVVVQCLIPGAGGRLRPNTFATVYLSVGTRRRELVIPASAVIAEGGKSFVFLKEGDEFTKTEVGLGERDADQVAVETGVKAGDIVASKGAFVLASEEKKGELKGHDH